MIPKGVMLHKSNKVDYTVVKFNWVISPLNYLGKVCEKVVTDMLADWREVYQVLHE